MMIDKEAFAKIDFRNNGPVHYYEADLQTQIQSIVSKVPQTGAYQIKVSV